MKRNEIGFKIEKTIYTLMKPFPIPDTTSKKYFPHINISPIQTHNGNALPFTMKPNQEVNQHYLEVGSLKEPHSQLFIAVSDNSRIG